MCYTRCGISRLCWEIELFFTVPKQAVQGWIGLVGCVLGTPPCRAAVFHKCCACEIMQPSVMQPSVDASRALSLRGYPTFPERCLWKSPCSWLEVSFPRSFFIFIMENIRVFFLLLFFTDYYYLNHRGDEGGFPQITSSSRYKVTVQR